MRKKSLERRKNISEEEKFREEKDFERLRLKLWRDLQQRKG